MASLIDIVIAIVMVIAIANGYRRGFWLSLFQYAGLVVGVIVGAALAPIITASLNLTATGVRSVAAILVMVICGSLGSTFGYWIGEPIRSAILGRGFARPPELLAGSLFSAIATLSVCWFLGLTFANGPSTDLARLIQNSAVLRAMDVAFPRPPGFLARVQATLAQAPIPAFAGLNQPNVQTLTPPASADTAGVRAATQSVYRVEGQGCGGVVSGSAYPVAPGFLVTNAHVVSGTSNTRVSQDSTGAGSTPASVVLFDYNRDVAILYAPGVRVAGLPTGSGDRGTPGAVIGYPGGGGETVSPSVIEEGTPATGRDIYNNSLVTRDIWILAAQVHPGNSGGPLVDMNGRVLGMVFAASSTNPNQAYALTNAEIQPDIDSGVGRTAGVNTASYSCAV